MTNRVTGSTTSQAVLKALAGALLPAVRVFQMGGCGVGEFEVAARLAFVQVAAVQGRTKGGRTNVSRIAAMTGLTRKEVRHLLQILEAKSHLVAPSATRQRTARVLEAWRADPLYLDDRGRPLVLLVAGEEPSFRSLVRSYAGDVTPISVLRELERTGAVSTSDDGHVRCRSQSAASGAVDAAFLLEFAQRLQQFTTALATAAEPGEGRLFYAFREASISPPDLARLFLTTFSDRAASLLDGADRWVASRQRQRRPRGRLTESGADSVNVRLGVFLADDMVMVPAPPPVSPAPTPARPPARAAMRPPITRSRRSGR
jgi:hypothetical protein